MARKRICKDAIVFACNLSHIHIFRMVSCMQQPLYFYLERTLRGTVSMREMPPGPHAEKGHIHSQLLSVAL